MQALYWNGRELRLERSYPTPNRADQTALVKVHLAGICSTDLQIFRGYMGFNGVPGHEFVGSVVDGPSPWGGKRVVGEINFGCGHCEFCGRELGRHCAERRVMGIAGADGAFAEYVSLPAANLHVIPDTVSDEEAVFTEPLAAAFEILEQVQIDPGDEVLVIGDGKLGSLCAQVLRLTGARVTALGKHPEKLSQIKRSGVRTVLLQDWQPRRFDLVVEATGSAGGLESALNSVRPRGTLVLKSTIAGEHRLSLAPLVIHEITLIGSRCGPFPEAVKALAEKSVAVTPLIEAVFPLTQGTVAVERAARPGARKVLLRPEG
jgi:threonine dehydrogenase-like Zn-dependent dehydrogenase